MSQTQTKPFICPDEFQPALAEVRRAWFAFGVALKREPTADETRGIDAIVALQLEFGAERIEILQQLHTDLLRHVKRDGFVETFTYHDGSYLHLAEEKAARFEVNPGFKWTKVKSEEALAGVRTQQAENVKRFGRKATVSA